jgi:ABC-2 type transport system ATP-binding protein
LGSNGAGKTTAIGIICGLLNKTQGDIQILGLNQNTHTNDIKRLIGLMSQEFNIQSTKFNQSKSSVIFPFFSLIHLYSFHK